MAHSLFSIFLLFCLLLNSSLQAKHALWVWDMADDIVLDEKDRMDFWSFIEAPQAKPELKISTIYLSVGKDLLNSYPKKVSEFIADAHSRGLQVEYLTGDPLWALSEIDICSYEEDGSRVNGCVEEANDTPYNKPSFDELEDLLSYNADALENERFDGYHQDTEPYILGTRSGDPVSWGDDDEKEDIWNQFVATMSTWKSMVDDHNTETGDDLVIGSAIPFWLDVDKDGDGNDAVFTSPQTIQGIMDYVSIMNYNTRSGFQGGVANEINYASANGKNVYVGIETQELNYKEPVGNVFQQMYTPTASYFYGRSGGNGTLGIEGLAQDVAFLENVYASASAYKGIAFHFYEDIANGDNALRALGYEPYEHSPAVWIVSPSYEEIFSGTETIRYIVYDPDGDALNVAIEYSSDGGENWSSVSNLNLTDRTNEIIHRTLQWDVSNLVGDDYLLKVTANEVNKALPLVGYDLSDYTFSIVSAKTDTANPDSVAQSSINWSYDTYGEINLWWGNSADNAEVAGYYYSYLPNNPHLGSFSRGNRVRTRAPEVDSTLYLWAIDNSGNLSAPTTWAIFAIEDIDQDGVVNEDTNEADRDGDGVSDLDEISEGTNPDDPLDFGDARVIGHWKLDNNLNNAVTGEPNLTIDDNNGTITDGSLNYTNGALASGQAIEISGSEPIWLPLGTNPTSHQNLYALTIEMWIKPDLVTKDELPFIPLACFGDLDAGLTLLLKNDGDLLSLRRYTDSSSGAYASINAQNDDLFDGEWHHIACSYNGYSGALKLFIDGKLVSSGQKSKGPLLNNRVLRFFDGRSNYDNQNGLLSNELMIFSGQFENTAYGFTDREETIDIVEYPIRYLGLVDNIKVTKAAVPIELLGYYQDRSEDYDTWKEAAFGSDASDDSISGINVDYSNDGISNFLSYAYGLNPTVNNSTTLMNTPVIETKGGQQYLSLRYLESKTATAHFQVQTNTTLNSLDWSDQTDVVSYLDGESGNSWIRKVNVPFDDEIERLFIRMEAGVNSN